MRGNIMVKMVNALFGNDMYVSEDKVPEYVSAGHKLADTPKPEEKPKSKKKTAKKAK